MLTNLPELKPFDRTLFDENDYIAREAVKRYFSAHEGIELVDNPDRYGIDLIQNHMGIVVFGCEVERRHNWIERDFPFSTVHIPFRKLKFAELYYPTFYALINEKVTHGLLAPFNVLETAMLIENPNKFVEYGELFYDIDLTNFTEMDLRFKGYGDD